MTYGERNILYAYLGAKYGAGTGGRYTNTAGFRYHVGGIGQESNAPIGPGTSAGLTIINGTFLANGNYLLAGVASLSPDTDATATDAPSGYGKVAKRLWYLDRTTPAGGVAGTVTLKFKLGDLGITATNGDQLALVVRTVNATTGVVTYTPKVIAKLDTTNNNDYISFSLADPQDGYYTLAVEPWKPKVTVSLATSVQSDRVNTEKYKAIPGGLIKAVATISNTGPGVADTGTTVMSLPIPAGMKFYVGDIGATGSGPVVLAQGTTGSGLTYTYTALTNTADGLEFSKDSGATWTYQPTADGDKCDAAITNVRVKTTGVFAATAAATPTVNPSFTLTYGMMVK